MFGLGYGVIDGVVLFGVGGFGFGVIIEGDYYVGVELELGLYDFFWG